MTRNDYQMIAGIIHGLPRTFGLRNRVAKHFAQKLRDSNMRFNTPMFLEACGYIEEGDDE
jgi:hypothetical protein